MKGFTLIQLLLAIVIFCVLAAVTYVAINPQKGYSIARNNQRFDDLKAYMDGLNKYSKSNKGSLFPGIDSNLKIIGNGINGCSVDCIVTGNTQISRVSNLYDDSAPEFNKGTYSNTKYTGGGLQLDSNGKNSGTGNFTSQLFDGQTEISWLQMKWNPERPYNIELPNNNNIETSYTQGNVNMSGNTLLLHLNENSNIVIDSSGKNNSGTSYNTLYNSNGRFNGAYDFNSPTSYIQIPNSSSLNPETEITLEAWVKLDLQSASKSGLFQILSKDNGYQYQLQINFDNYIFEFTLNTTQKKQSISSTTRGIDGGWYHIVGTYNGIEQKLYINGIPEAKAGLTGQIIKSDEPVEIGKFIKNTNSMANDKLIPETIDEIVIFNKALTDSEIQNHYLRAVMNLKFQTRVCNDTACSGVDFTGPDNQAGQYYNDFNTPNFIIPLTSNTQRYFQYKAFLETGNTDFSPNLFSVSILTGKNIAEHITTSDSCIDLSTLRGSYMDTLPFDPLYGSSVNTYYAVRSTGNNLELYACKSELGLTVKL
jgi:hypothetical protein